MKVNLPAAVTTRVARQILLTQKHSPTLLFVGGVVGVVATTVTACRATLKLDDILDDAEYKFEKAQIALDLNTPSYTEADYKKDRAIVTIQTAVSVVRLYGPSIILGTLSIAALTGSHNILNNRYTGLSAAYTALDQSFKQYRAGVVEEYGEEKDRELRFGSAEKTITVEDEKGPKKKKVKVHGGRYSQYSKFFGEGNINWSEVPESNVMFLRCQQNMANQILHAKGHIFLNEVYDMLGIGRTKAGQQVGWVRGNGDNEVDFCIWDDRSMERFHSFVTGLEDEILLDFNVDGVILDLIEKK